MTLRLRVALLILLLGLPDALAAQEEAPSAYRRYLYAGIGAVALGTLGSLQSDRGEDAGLCSDRICLMGAGAALGGFIGFLVGSDLDAKARERWGGGRTLVWSPTFVTVEAIPERMVGPASAGMLATSSGLLLAPSGAAPRLILPGARIFDAALLPGDRLLVGTAAGLLAATLATGAVDTLESAPTGALQLEEQAVLAGQRGAVRRLRLPDVRESARGEVTGLPTEVHVAPNAVLSVSGGALVAHDPQTLATLGTLALPGASLDLDLDGTLAAVASGVEGVVLVDVSQPAAPRIAGRLSGMRSATSAALGGGRAYVAAGGQGLYIFDVADPAAPRLIGNIRDFGFVAEVRLEDGRLYVLDRARRRVYSGDPAGIVAASQ